MYTQGELDKKERRKIIAAATVTTALILILLVAIIVVATKKSSQASVSEPENVAFELTESEEETTEKNAEEKTETIGVISTEQSETKVEETIENTEVITTELAISEELPTTGAEEILPIAILLGAFVAYLSSAVLAKKEA